MRPILKVTLDIAGPFPRTNDGNNYYYGCD